CRRGPPRRRRRARAERRHPDRRTRRRCAGPSPWRYGTPGARSRPGWPPARWRTWDTSAWRHCLTGWTGLRGAVTAVTTRTRRLHPERRERPRPGHRRRVDRGQREPEHRTGLARVDDAVVPQPPAGIDRVGLPGDHRLDELAGLRVG